MVGKIGHGLLVLLGIAATDSESDADYLIDKIVNLRIFEDADKKMNASLVDVDGGLLVVSQFTLYGDTRRGRRPSFIKSAGSAEAEPLYEYFLAAAGNFVKRLESGRFGAMMAVELVNAGPVTIILDSEKTI